MIVLWLKNRAPQGPNYTKRVSLYTEVMPNLPFYGNQYFLMIKMCLDKKSNHLNNSEMLSANIGLREESEPQVAKGVSFLWRRSHRFWNSYWIWKKLLRNEIKVDISEFYHPENFLGAPYGSRAFKNIFLRSNTTTLQFLRFLCGFNTSKLIKTTWSYIYNLLWVVLIDKNTLKPHGTIESSFVVGFDTRSRK